MSSKQSYSFDSIVVTWYFFFLFSFILLTFVSPTLQFCRHDQRDALLEFKHEFPLSYMSSWNKSSDCCSWENVTCDTRSGKVISLDLNNIPFNNSLKPNSGLFKLQYLQHLAISFCNLNGEIPSSLGKLSHLTYLDLSQNELVGQVPTSIGNLTQLSSLILTDNHLSGKLPVSFANLTKLSTLHLTNNNFESELPHEMSRLHNLEYVLLSGNSFSGPFPTFLFTISSLQMVYSRKNQFKGPIEFGNTSSSSRLHSLSLSSNQCDGPIPESISKFVHLNILDLSFNNFTGSIPRSISKLANLHYLDLSYNKLEGEVPHCLWSLQLLKLSYNSFSSFGKSSEVLDGTQMNLLSLKSNSFRGPFPHWICDLRSLGFLDLSINNFNGVIPPCLMNNTNLIVLNLGNNNFSGTLPDMFVDEAQMKVLDLDSNSFRGPFPHWICKLRSLKVLVLSSNGFSGSIPPCVRNNDILTVLKLRNNNFSGILPDIFVNATNLVVLDVSRNKLEGKLLKSLKQCKAMELLNVEYNKFEDKFPYWSGYLPSLKVLILRSNNFYGPLYHRHVSFGFKNLTIIDISQNNFSGTFPTLYFSNWDAMITAEFHDDKYTRDLTVIDDMEKDMVIYMVVIYMVIDMVHKGVMTEFKRIRADFIVIDLSGNKFCGKIPESIGLLKGLHELNLSSNAFTNDIPKSLANLTNLEALDLSRNQLIGQIPQDLGVLSFISTMDFSHNNLEGPIPQGTQFQTQNCSSFMDNPKLYGLEVICGKPPIQNSTTHELEESFEPEEEVIDWIAAAVAYGPGVFCGLVIGHIFISHKHEWFMEKFRQNKPSVVINNAR